MSGRLEMGIFPLALVLLPGEVLPLHIFEERYKRLFADLLPDGEFGIMHVDEGGVHEYGCAAKVIEVVERFDDGRLNVLVRGSRRVRLLELDTPADLESDYMRGVVDLVEDAESDAPPDLVADVLRVFRELLGLLAGEEPPPSEGVPLSYLIGAAVELDAAVKQELLEGLSEHRRLEALLAALQALMPRAEAWRKRQEAIRGNGKGA